MKDKIIKTMLCLTIFNLTFAFGLNVLYWMNPLPGASDTNAEDNLDSSCAARVQSKVPNAVRLYASDFVVSGNGTRRDPFVVDTQDLQKAYDEQPASRLVLIEGGCHFYSLPTFIHFRNGGETWIRDFWFDSRFEPDTLTGTDHNTVFGHLQYVGISK